MSSAHASFSSSRVLAMLVAAATATIATSALADALPTGTSKQASATSGSTDVATGSMDSGAKDSATSEKDKNATELALSGGAVLAGGNTQSTLATGSVRFRIRRDRQQVTFLAAANYGRAEIPPATTATTTAENYQARLRYDYFFADHWSFFLGAQARRDRFQGLDLRAQLDPGIAYYFIDSKKTNVWIEAGYDYLHDIRYVNSEGQPLNPDGSIETVTVPSPFTPTGTTTSDAAPIGRTNTQHSGRVFLGYTDAFSDGVSFALGLEFLQSFTDSNAFRFNGDALLTAKLSRKFALVTGLSVRYDNEPVEGKLPLDTLTTVSLSYTVL